MGDAVRAASALSKGIVKPEDALCQSQPWLIDASNVLAALRKHEGPQICPWSNSVLPQPGEGLVALRHAGPPTLEKFSPYDLPPALIAADGVLFGTADALL